MRDGLQNEPFILSLEEKQELLQRLMRCGFEQIEVGSFVHPKLVPQMAGTAEVMANASKVTDVAYYALIPNLKGYELALKAGFNNVAYVLAVTETMNMRNVNMTVDESFRQFHTIYKMAKKDGINMRVYLAVVFHCPFEGVTSRETALHWIERMAELKVENICLADTDGKTEPKQLAELLNEAIPLVRQKSPKSVLSLHLHKTYGNAEINLKVALEKGIRHFDSATAGLGGCPFAPGAKGNIATEDLVAICHQDGYETGVNVDELAETSKWLTQLKTL